MNNKDKTGLIIGLVIVGVLFLFFGGGAMSGSQFGSGMMGTGRMGGIHWMWFPTVVMVGIGLLLGWAIFGKK